MKPTQLDDLERHLFHEGKHWRLWETLGAHPTAADGTAGCRFAVWAPNADGVAVVGDFNRWDTSASSLSRQQDSGVWEVFVPHAQPGQCYKFAVWSGGNSEPVFKTDPMAKRAELPPANASIIAATADHDWQDGDWLSTRGEANRRDAAISIYEVHLGSWRRPWTSEQRYISYREAAESLVDYVVDMGFTHIEFLPISEFPFDGSWGYQPIGMYAPTSRYGNPDDLRALIDAAHQRGIGILIDWVPAHFPEDEHGLRQFDGTALYEYADPKEGYHQDWNTLIYNFDRWEVANFLIANSLYWLESFHIDGLRVDAVASMLYRDYSRNDGEWLPNRHGGRENLEAIALLQKMNTLAYGENEGIATFAEESTAFPGVSRPVDSGGLGFGFKWNMGWMNDTLRYMAEDPINRRYHHHLMTFGIHYGFTENFVLPISHDEVVHGKGSMLNKMPGSEWEKFANLRAYYGYMWGHPGKKLLFMGCELAQKAEWNHDGELDWHCLQDPAHSGVQNLVRDLNRLYRTQRALHLLDCEPDGFVWVDGNAADESLFAWLRIGQASDAPVLVVVNMTPVERQCTFDVPRSGVWREELNTDATIYGGTGKGNLGSVETRREDGVDRVDIYLPPLSTLFFVAES